MARPKPTVILSTTDKVTHLTKDVSKIDCVYSVCYDGQPISVRNYNPYINDSNIKYIKTSYSTAATAINHAKRLNQQFKTDKFKVFRLSVGECVS